MLDQSYIFSAEDILLGTIWLVIIIALGFVIRSINSDKPEYKWFMPNLFFKLGMGIFFVITHKFLLGYMGDTGAYWDGANKLNNLFWESPGRYFNELFTTPAKGTIGINFNYNTGFPPGWIYYDPNSFFVSKVFSILSLLTLKSYLALTIICAFIASLGSFKLYQLVRRFNFTKEKYIIIVTMFIPSVAFYCSGATKDMIIVSCLFIILYHVFSIFDSSRKFTFKSFLIVLFFSLILYNTRSFMIIAIITPLLLSFGLGYINKLKNNIIKYLLNGLIIIFAFGSFALIFSGTSLPVGDEYVDELIVKQKDFSTNKTYGEHRYDLGIQDYSPAGLISAAPSAIVSALYRPFLWEAQGALMYISGVESTILLFLTFLLFIKNGGVINNFRFIFKRNFLIFSLVFVLFFGFFVGFSSGLFNILIRFKAPILPFLFLVLSPKNMKKQNH